MPRIVVRANFDDYLATEVYGHIDGSAADFAYGDRHILFLVARDDSATSGAVSAEFFWLPDPRGPVRRPTGRLQP